MEGQVAQTAQVLAGVSEDDLNGAYDPLKEPLLQSQQKLSSLGISSGDLGRMRKDPFVLALLLGENTCRSLSIPGLIGMRLDASRTVKAHWGRTEPLDAECVSKINWGKTLRSPLSPNEILSRFRGKKISEDIFLGAGVLHAMVLKTSLLLAVYRQGLNTPPVAFLGTQISITGTKDVIQIGKWNPHRYCIEVTEHEMDKPLPLGALVPLWGLQ